ncbi:MAG: peptidoglycan DD-metalloendopeptidase family protein [Alphaproteobacteria bacterium]|nr:peptidoglycan DD-metalloendopeptidase family protein [Alphaproteobacteria bacterium]
MKRIIALFIIVLSGVQIAHGANDLAQIKSQIQQAEKQSKELSVQVASSERDIAKTKKQLVKAADQVSSLESQRAEIAKKIAELDMRIDSISREIEKNRGRISEAAASILFVAKNPSFDAENMHDFVLTSSILTGAADNFAENIETANKQVAELERVRNARANEKEKLDRTAKKYVSQRNELDKLLRTRSAQNEQLKTKQADVQKKLRDLSARAKSISELSAGVGSSEMSADARFSRRKLNLPVRGRVVVRYGEKTALGLKSDGWRIRTRGDALVMAPADGIVKFADSFRGFGRVVIMSHKNGYNTVMTNLGAIDVLPEQEVLAGEPVGRMSADKQEMYLEVRRGNQSVDPARLFRDDD